MSESSDKLRRIVGNLIAAESAGQIIADQRVIARHPELADELPDALQFLDKIRSAEVESLAAGAIDGPLELYSDEELWAPIDCDAAGPHASNIQEYSVSKLIVGYELLEPIGQGGQATVYRGRKISTGGSVAIKVLPGGFFATTRARARFDREAQAMVKINHPNVVPVLDKGRTQDGSQFIVMEYVEGLPLDRFLMPHEDAVRTAGIFAKIAHAVQELHRCDIVHRDLKPSNILVDRYGQPRVLDFGLAQIENMPGVTDTGQVLGSLPWVSPEQASGRLEDVSEQSDIYSIGVMLAYILDGKLPYPTSGSSIETANHICKTPARVGLGRQKTPLDNIALKCLAKRPEDRYGSAAELALELDRVTAGTGPSRRSMRPTSRLLLWSSITLIVASLGLFKLARLAVAPFRSENSPLLNPAPLDPVIDLPNFTNKEGMRFVLIPAGTFMMGSSTRQPGHSLSESQALVQIASPFYLAVTETTQKTYDQVMQLIPEDTVFHSSELPARQVTYWNALKFCERLGNADRRTYRLPTEAEWEYACRASSDSKTLSESNLSESAWWANNSGGKIHPVQKLAPNRWGLYDMLGGVAEWCLAPSPSDSTYPSIAANFGMAKGGSFESTASDCRSSACSMIPKYASSSSLGFRVVLLPSELDLLSSHSPSSRTVSIR